MSVSRLDPNLIAAASSSASSLSTSVERTSGQSFAEVLKAQARATETGRSGALASLLARGAAEIAPSPETGVIRVQAAPPTSEIAAEAGAALREWSGASRSKTAKNGSSPLALSGHDASLAGRYDVLARRDDPESRGVRHNARA